MIKSQAELTRSEVLAISDSSGPSSSEIDGVRRQMLHDYLQTIRDAGDISADTAKLAWNAWQHLREAAARDLSVPDAAPGPEGQLLYAWNKSEHHLELEIFPNRPAEFFYFNRVSQEAWEEAYHIDQPLSQQAQDKFAIFSYHG